MKKIFLPLLFLLALANTPRANAQVFGKDAKLLNVGIGLGAGYGGGTPIGLAFDYGLSKNFSLGFQADFMTWRYNYGGGDYDYRFLPVGVRGAYHFDGVGDPNKVDLYLGLVLGYWISSYTGPKGYSGRFRDDYGSKALYGLLAGVRYMFAPRVGGFAELGYGVSYGKVGLTFKL